MFTISRRDRNRPFTLAEALDVANDPRARLLVNAQSGRAAIQVSAPSLMLDDGEVERRVRLIRPMERPAIPLSALTGSHWQESDHPDFIRAWETELAAVTEFADSSLHIVTGLLLPIWKRLPDDSMRVYRLQTDDGERIIGRLVSPAWVAQAVETETPALDRADAFATLLDVLRREVGVIGTPGAARIGKDENALLIIHEGSRVGEIGRSGTGLDGESVGAVLTSPLHDASRASRAGRTPWTTRFRGDPCDRSRFGRRVLPIRFIGTRRTNGATTRVAPYIRQAPPAS